mgnify:FL=1
MSRIKQYQRKLPRYREITSQKQRWASGKGFGIHLVSTTDVYIGGAGIVTKRPPIPHVSDKTRMCVYGVDIEPGYRGEGYGYVIFEEAKRYAANSGCTCLAGYTPNPRQVVIRKTTSPDTEFYTGTRDTLISADEAYELTSIGKKILALTPLKKGGCK